MTKKIYKRKYKAAFDTRKGSQKKKLKKINKHIRNLEKN